MDLDPGHRALRRDVRPTSPATESATLSELLRVLSDHRNRRILYSLLQQDAPLATGELTDELTVDGANGCDPSLNGNVTEAGASRS